MSKVELLALGLGGRLLDARAGHQLLAPYDLISPTIARDDQGFSCCHHNHQMIHTIPNPVNLFLPTNIKRVGDAQATTWNTDLDFWVIT
ncbi:MAG TPA: hypothetical protein VE866_12030 [Candidatus Binatia bacterium]|nr:hypothetical protein [Candidatus Binatia bacterium]